MGNLLGWLFVLGIGVPASIALHEIGHLIPAKAFGVKCTQYMIGFGPTLWSRRRGETQYGVKAIPLGGYVRMIGMYPPKAHRDAGTGSAGRWTLMIDQARRDAQREIGPGDADRLFYQRSVPKRLVIMLGGPVMNLLIAIVLLTGLVTLYGVPTATTTVQTVSKCVLPESTATAPATARECTSSDLAAPAAKAGLLPGDVIVSYEGVQVSTWAPLRDLIRANRGTPVQLVVRRGDQLVPLTATPLVDDRVALDRNGNKVKGADGAYVTTRVGFLGVTPRNETVGQPVTAVPGILGDALTQTAGVVLQIPAKMVGVVQTIVSGGQRDPNGPISLIGVGRLAGEVGSAQGTSTSPVTLGDKIATWLSLVASLNLALFVFNLIPLLPLDGGHVAGALWEAVRRGFARLGRRPDPGPVDIARALPIAYAVVVLLIGFSGLLFYIDIVNPVHLGG